MDAYPDYATVWHARAGAVSAAGGADRLRHDGHARDHSGSAGDGPGAAYVDQHDAVDDHAVSDRARRWAIVLRSGVGPVRAAAGAARGPDVVHDRQHRYRVRAE